MQLGELLGTIRRQGIAVVSYINREELDAAAVAELLGCSLLKARQVLRVGEHLAGPCPKPEREHQAAAVRDAERFGLPLEGLVEINKQIRKLAKDIEYSRYQLHAEIIAACEGLSVDEIRLVALVRVRELNGPSKVKPIPHVEISATPDVYNQVTIIGRLDIVEHRDFLHWLRTATQRRYRRSGRLTFGQTRAAVLAKFSARSERTSVGVHAVIRAGELRGTTRKKVALTNGTTVNFRELFDASFESTGWAVVYDDATALPLDAFRIQRFANRKQSQVLIGHQLVCAAPGCEIPADECQAHHIQEWGHGGETNIKNLVKVCPAHHGILSAGRAHIEPDNTGGYLWCDHRSGLKRTTANPIVELAGGNLV